MSNNDLAAIVFVDDEPNILEGLKRMTRSLRHEWNLKFYHSAQEMLEAAEGRKIEVLVTDLAMPGLTGMDLVRQVNETYPETRCIILTGSADLEKAAEIINTVDVFRFFTKPCEADLLIEGIRAASEQYKHNQHRQEPNADFAMDGVLDRLSIGVLLLQPGGEILFMNQSAVNILAEEDGLSVGRENILKAGNPELSKQIVEDCQMLIQDPAEEGGQTFALSVPRPSLKNDLKLIFTRYPVSPGHEDQVLLFLTDPEIQTLPSAEMLSRLFNLSPAEGRLARELASGKKVEEISEAMGITVSSVRTYLKRLMEKTGTSRQAELVRLLLSMPQLNH